MTRYAQHILALLLGVLMLAGVFAPVAANAQSNTVTVEVILASSEDTSVDPALSAHAPRLAMQFGSYTHFELSSSQTYSLDAPVTVAVPGGELTIARTDGGQLSITMPDGYTTTIGIPAGSVHFQMGPSVDGGTLLIAISPSS